MYRQEDQLCLMPIQFPGFGAVQALGQRPAYRLLIW
jgi:hypothetical protein